MTPYPDPGEPWVWDDESKMRLLTEKWTLVKDCRFPSRLIGSKERRFNANWMSDFIWLRYSVAKDAVLCAPCLLFEPSQGKEKAFRSSPVNDWKNFSAYVKRNSVEDIHRVSLVLADNFEDVISGKKESINSQLSTSVKNSVHKNRYILQEIIETLVLLGQQNIAIRGHTEDKSNFMAILQSKAKHDEILADHLANAHSKAKYTSPDIQNEIIQLCGNQLLSEITDECKHSVVVML